MITSVALPTAAASLPAAARSRERPQHPSRGCLSAVVRHTGYGIPHILAED